VVEQCVCGFVCVWGGGPCLYWGRSCVSLLSESCSRCTTPRNICVVPTQFVAVLQQHQFTNLQQFGCIVRGEVEGWWWRAEGEGWWWISLPDEEEGWWWMSVPVRVPYMWFWN
jgi:hypothetical protein